MSEDEGGGRTVLLVEDNETIRHAFRILLEDSGYAVAEAGSGQEALDRAAAEVPALILMDLGLPDTSGWKILDAMREHYAEVKMEMPIVIIITAYGDPANRLVGKLQNIHSYVLKPFTADEIERVVISALGLGGAAS